MRVLSLILVACIAACSSSKTQSTPSPAPSSGAAGQAGAGGSAAGASGQAQGGAGSGAGAGSGNGGSGGTGIGEAGAGNAGLDFSIWSLQLPTGSNNTVTTISPAQLLAGYSDDYFHLGSDGGQVFMDPATGVTTSGSLHCRTELREMTASGSGAAWAPTGTNTLSASGMVSQLGGGAQGHVTLAQVFIASDSGPLCELEYSAQSGGFELLYEEQKGAGTYTDLMTPIALGERYDFTLSLSNGVLDVSVNGSSVFTRTPSAATLAKAFYFKLGNYDQTATAGAISTVPYTVVEVYSASIVHP